MRTRGRPRYPGTLTPRQQEVFALLQQGLTNEEIAQRLGITLDGVKFHVTEILSRLGVSSRHEAAAVRDVRARRAWALAPFSVLGKLKWNAASYAATAAGAVVLIVGSVLLAWGLTRTNRSQPHVTSTMRTYTSSRFGYSLQYPDSYFEREDTNLTPPVLNDKYLATSDVGSPIDLPPAGLWITVRVSANTEQLSLEGWAAGHPHSSPAAVVSGVTRLQVGGRPAIQQVEDQTGMGPEAPAYSVVTYVDRGDRILPLVGVAENGAAFRSRAAEYQAIVDSVRLFAPATP